MTFLLLFCSLLLVAIGNLKNSLPIRYRKHWIALGLIFLFLAMDETLSFHERLSEPLRNQLNLTGVLYYAWIIPAGFFLLFLAFSFRKFFFSLPPRFRKMFFLAGFIYVAGAIGTNMVGAKIASVHGEWNLTYQLVASLEEILEMFGLIFFIHSLFSFIKSLGTELTLRIE